MSRISDNITRKFIDTIELEEYEILTDSGWEDITHIHKTIEYEEWTLETSSGKFLICADDHIIFDENYNELFVKDCIENVTKVLTENGVETVTLVRNTHKMSNMYDITVDSDEHRYYTNGILSHNTTTAAAIILHYILFNNSKTVGLLANKGDAAREILERIKIAYEALPDWLQQGVVRWNEGDIKLENGCKVIAAATTSSTIRGKSISFLYIDECVGGSTNVCVEIRDSYYYSRISNFINIDESDFINKKETDMIGTIYKTVNKINKKEYIGLHRISSEADIMCEITETGSVFRDGYMGSGIALRQAIIKYKPENFRQELMFVSSDIDEVSKFESDIVNENYVNTPNTYNLKCGGLNYNLNPQATLTKGEKISNWIKENPEKHKNRMEKINKNPDKISKTAEKHRGLKRSAETCGKISEALAARMIPANNKGKITIFNPENMTKKYINVGDEIPEGYILGAGVAGPKGKRSYFNPETNEIKYFIEDESPSGWRLGRK